MAIYIFLSFGQEKRAKQTHLSRQRAIEFRTGTGVPP
jgi:hypothetical protein